MDLTDPSSDNDWVHSVKYLIMVMNLGENVYITILTIQYRSIGKYQDSTMIL